MRTTSKNASRTNGTTNRSTRNTIRTGTALDAGHRPMRNVQDYQFLADSSRGTGGQKTADFLGLFSLALGAAETFAPGLIAHVIGVKEPTNLHRRTIRLMGLREMTSGLAILSCERPAEALWSRVVGDGIDLALLAKVATNPDNDRGRTLFAIANVAAVTALDLICAKQLSKQPDTQAGLALDNGLIRVHRAITVGRPVEEVYGFWRDFENLPRFMKHLESVTVTGENRSHWVAHAPAGQSVEWDAEMIEDRPNELIAWRSLHGSDVFNVGSVYFQPAPAGRGTEVRVEIFYHPPFGKLASKIAMLWRQEPRQQIADDLRRFKQVLEIGEVVLSDATVGDGPHPAVPSNNN
jgi:uncharacterized membrane protein